MPDKVYSLVFVDVVKPGYFCEHNREQNELETIVHSVVDVFMCPVNFYPRTLTECMRVAPLNSVKEVLELYPDCYGIHVVMLPG
jgi:hypothetical protein